MTFSLKMMTLKVKIMRIILKIIIFILVMKALKLVILTFCWAFMFSFMAQMGFHTGETEKQQTFVDVVGVAALGSFHQRTVRLGGTVEQQAVVFASVFVGFEHGHVAPSAFREQSTGGTSVY